MDNSVIQNDRKIFQEERNELLYSILDNRFFQSWRRGPSQDIDDVPAGNLELFITPSCNQKCEYCYLQKYMDSLYPEECNNKETIFKNLRHLFDWCIEEKFNLPNLDLYSGEIWHTSFGLELLDIVYDYIYNKGLICKKITIPSNATFLEDDLKTVEIQNRIDRFKSIGVEFSFSLSIDGKYLEDIERERYDGSKRCEDFYDKVFTFAKHNSYGFHPMLSAKSAKYWIDNYKWWLGMLKKYQMPVDRIMLLEVRNDDWEEEDILEYQKFLRYLVDLTFQFHNNNFEDVIDDIFLLNQVYMTGSDRLWTEDVNYMPISLNTSKGHYGCTISQHLTVRLGDLAICPCHRTAYNKYLYGKFNQDENGKIIGMEANNPQAAINILLLDKRTAVLGCDSCIFNKFCLGTCRGQSIESMHDILRNDPKVCNFLYQKYFFMFKLFEEKGFMTWLENNLTKYHSAYTFLEPILSTWKKVKKEEKYNELAELRQDIYWKC